MVEKITALVFSILLLILSILLTIHESAVENIVAIVFSAIAVICNIIAIIRSPRVVELCEDEPNGKRAIDNVLKLSNELAPYVERKGGKIKITIVTK